MLEEVAQPGALGRRVEIGTPTRRAVVLAMDSPPAATAAEFFKLPQRLLAAMYHSQQVDSGAHVQFLPLPRVRQGGRQPQVPRVAKKKAAKKKAPKKKKKVRTLVPCFSVSLFLCFSVCQCIHLSVYPFIRLSVYPFIRFRVTDTPTYRHTDRR